MVHKSKISFDCLKMLICLVGTPIDAKELDLNDEHIPTETGITGHTRNQCKVKLFRLVQSWRRDPKNLGGLAIF